MIKSTLERCVETYIKRHKLPQPEREFRFHPVRKWRFDFAWPDHMVALEVDGGTFMKRKGGHSTGVGFHNDTVKRNAARMLGWRVYNVDTKLAKDELYVVCLIRRALGLTEAEA